MESRLIADGVVAVGDGLVLNIIEGVFQKQEELDKSSKYHPNDKVVVNASLEKLIEWFLPTERTWLKAKQFALLILNDPKGTVISATDCTDAGRCYTIETSDIPMLFLPEKFIRRV